MAAAKPTRQALANASTGLWVATTTAMAVMPPSAIRPSTPRLTTPTRSVSTSPSAARARTPPARMAVWMRPANRSIGSDSLRVFRRVGPHQPVARHLLADRGEEQDQAGDRQHGLHGDPLGLQDDARFQDDRHQERAGEHAEGGSARQH